MAPTAEFTPPPLSLIPTNPPPPCLLTHPLSLCDAPPPHQHKRKARTGAYKKAAARDNRLAGNESAKRKSKNSEQNHVPAVNVLIGYFPRTMGGANLVFSGLCHTFVPHVYGTSVAQAELDRSPYTRCLPNHAHTYAT